MHNEFNELLLRVEFLLMGFSVDEQLSFVAILDASLLYQRLHFGQVGRMTGHVSCEDDSDEPLPECLEVIAREVFQKVVLFHVQNRE